MDYNAMPGQVRVCFVSHSSYLGGAERALLEAVRALAGRGVACHVLLPYDGPLSSELAELGVPWKVIKYKPWVGKSGVSWWWRARDLLISLTMVVPVALAIARWKCGVVYTNTVTVYTGALAARLIRRPHIWHIHEYFSFEDYGFKFLYGERFSLGIVDRFSSLCLAASKACAGPYLKSIRPDKVRVLYQSVSVPEAVAPIGGSDGFTCVAVGKVSEIKNQVDAVRAVAELARDGMQVALYLIGDGSDDYAERLAGISRENGIEQSVRFMGYRDDAFSFIRGADAVLSCSRCEAFGRTAVEGMLAGKPVIGARSGATAELITENETGLFYTPGDHGELADKIRFLRDNPERARSMGEKARAWAMANFSEERYSDGLLAAVLAVSGAGA